MGAIPADYAFDGADLLIGGQTAEALIARAGDTPLFVYDMAIVRDRIARFRAAMPQGLALHYAIKANPHPDLLAAIAPLVDGLDVAAAGEMTRAIAVMPPDRISFAGPGKRDDELEAAIRAGVTINLESPGEGARAIAIGRRLDVRPQLAVRVNPDFELRGSGMRMGGRASAFGMDVADVAPLVAAIDAGAADWRGLHIFAGSQALDPQAIVETQAQTIALAQRLTQEIGRPAPLVNLGGGFGIPYFPGEQPVDLAPIGDALARALPGGAFAIELGRWLVGEAGVYLTRIVDRKVSNGETFLITDGGMHHQLAASGNFGTVVRRNYPIALASGRGGPDEVVNVVGCLCTPLDRLGDRVALPHAQVGDVIAVFMAGAYGMTASPSAFLGHVPAREMLLV